MTLTHRQFGKREPGPPVFALLAMTLATAVHAAVWPGQDWEQRTPESQGLAGAQLKKLAAFALKHGGGSGCVIRHGYMVKERGSPTKLADTKSNAKGTLGATLLGLALDEGRLKLEDLA